MIDVLSTHSIFKNVWIFRCDIVIPPLVVAHHHRVMTAGLIEYAEH